ncbi:MAG: DEAD/DEAH box helicase [Armatimonadota bacterium]
MMLFTDFQLDDRLQRALAAAEFVSPTPIQAAALPVAMAGRDLVGTAQTGTGKTAAFVLPILQQIINTPLDMRRTRAVILAPTRELVLQILAVVRQLAIHTNVRAVAVYGGVPMQQQTRALRGGVDIVVACPGRLLDHIKRRNPDLRFLDTLVLDEADRMLDMGFLPYIQEIIDVLPVKRQTMLFSATFAKSLNVLVQQTLQDPARIQVDNAVPAQTVRHSLYQVKHSMKAPMLTALLRQLIPESDAVLIFTQTRAGANQVAEHLYAEGMDVGVLHAEKTQRERQDTLDRFRAGLFPYLVATDIAARGIDVTSISHVINFDLPGKADDYLHRIGRTGRMERAGHAISLMTRGDVRSVREIERMLGKRIEVAQLENDDSQMSDAIPVERRGMVRAPKQHAASPATHRPPKQHRDTEERPRRAPRNAAPAEPSSRANRPERTQRADAPWSERRPRRTAERDASSAPPRAERPGKHRHESTKPTRKELRLQKFGPPTTQPPRPERADRRRVDGEGTRAPEAVNPATPGKTRPTRKPFTGMASVAKHNRRYAAGKRQPGEVPSGPRPYGKSGPAHESAATRPPHKKRSGRQPR